MKLKTVVVGGGVAGLTLAERLLKSDPQAEVVVIEREDAPGGLARSFVVDKYDFDIGPHRFHTFNSDVDDYLKEILQDSYVEIARKSSVYMAGNYRNWPLTLFSVLGLPFPVLFRSFLDLFNKPKIPHIKSFADFIRVRYGNNLYNFFFSAYTKKFTGIDAEELHVDWAQAGVNRAVIDKRVKADSLLSLLKGMLLPKPVETKFYYPSKGGIQTFCDMQVERIKESGGKVLLNTSVKNLVKDGGKVTGVILENAEVVNADIVYWTAPITLLYPEAKLSFINTLIVNIALSEEVEQNDYQWCYFGQEELIFSRLTIPRNFRKDCVPQGKDSIIVEITCDSQNEMWKNPESVKDRLLKDLASVDALGSGTVEFIDWRKIPETYPIYGLDYKEKLSSLDVPDGLNLIGRSGSFWYNNMDHSIAQSLSIINGTDFKKNFWNHN